MQHPRNAARGQILIISAAALIVLMAIGAIVVDLGMSWLLHRREQNAVDPASVAAAHWVAPFGNQVQRVQEACFYVQQNGFFTTDLGCAAAIASGDLQVNSPPATTKAGNFRGRPGYVEVIITDTHPSFFGQLFGRPVAEVTTAAVAANTEGNSNSSSLIALGGACTPPDDGDSGLSGHANIRIHPADNVTDPGGYINVNAPCGQIRTPDVCDGNGNASALGITGGAQVTAPFIFVAGGCGIGGGGTLTCLNASPCLDEQTIPIGDPLGDLPEPWPLLEGALDVPSCPDSGDINDPSDSAPCDLDLSACPSGTCTMEDGVYYAGWAIGPGVHVVLKPGLYVFAGGGIQMNSDEQMSAIGDVDAGGDPIEARVTIFSTEHTAGCQAGTQNFCQGDIRVNTNQFGSLQLTATNASTCQQVSPTICTWKGILLWQDDTVLGAAKPITITAQSTLYLAGTIYAPESRVDIAGGANGTGCRDEPPDPKTCLAIQIISRQWSISGGGDIDMPYDPDELYQLEQQGLVH